MRLSIFFCLPLVAVVLGESPQSRGYDRRSYEAVSPGGEIDEDSIPLQGEISKYINSGLEEGAEEARERQTPTRRVIDPEVADQLEGNGWLDVIPGTSGKDYPNYERIPETSFTCDDKTPGGYYADIEARCQAFHVCNTGGQKSSFLCPSGSIFNQKYLVCDWWYDFECDDATDLYSLNEKLNRGGTGSGPSGPGRIEESVEYPFGNENSPEERLQNNGNFVSADGLDLSLAGTGEGGPGYARNGNSKGYQGNVNDEENHEGQNRENQGRDTGRKNVNNQRTAAADEPSKMGHSRQPDKKEERNQAFGTNRSNERDELPRRFSSGSNLERESAAVSSDARGSREHFRKQNSGAAGNSRVNYQTGYVNSNSGAALETDNIRNGRDRKDRAEQSNGFNERGNNQGEYRASNNGGNNNEDHPRMEKPNYQHDDRNRNVNQNGFGERSPSIRQRDDYHGVKTEENNYNQGSSPPGFNQREFRGGDEAKGQDQRNDNEKYNPARSSESNDYEFRSSSVNGEGTKPTNIRGRQRTGGGLPGGLGNGYPSLGGARELPGSDAIAGSINPPGKVYDKGDQRPVNYHRKTSHSGSRTPGQITDLRSDNDSQKTGLNYRNREVERPDFIEDNFAPEVINDSYNLRESSKKRKHSFDSNNEGGNNPGTDQRRQNHPVINYGNDYLVGIVPKTEDPQNSDQSRRFLPIL